MRSCPAFVDRCCRHLEAAGVVAWLSVALAPSLAVAGLPIFGTPVGLASAELSVGRVNNWFSLTEGGDSVSSLNSSTPARFGPSGTTLLPGLASSSPRAIGLLDDSTVLGNVTGPIDGYSGGGTRAVRWPGGSTGPVLMGTLGESSAGNAFVMPLAHNAAGVTVGYGTRYVNGSAVGSFRPVLWSPGGTITELGGLATDGAFPDTRAQRVNDSGVAIGWGRPATSFDIRPIKWLPGSPVAIELETFPDGSTGAKRRGDANAINAAGTVVGSSQDYSVVTTTGVARAVRWDAGGAAMTPLQGLAANAGSEAFGLNDAGDVVGSSSVTSGVQQATLWPAGQTVPTTLAGLPDPTPREARAYAINGSRSIVGYGSAHSPAGQFLGHRATLWLGGGPAVTDLNTLLDPDAGWTLEEAGAISETGFIRGTGAFDPDGAGGAAAYRRSWTMLVPQAGSYGRGDANFDTVVDFADLLLLAQRYGQANPSLNVGVADLNLDGQTNFNDLLVLAQHYGTGVASSLAQDWASARSLVPEPSTAAGLLPAAALISRRRRRVR